MKRFIRFIFYFVFGFFLSFILSSIVNAQEYVMSGVTDSNIESGNNIYGSFSFKQFGAYYRGSTSTNINVNDPFRIYGNLKYDFDISQYDYIDISGYSNFSTMVMYSSQGACENIANSSSSFSNNNSGQVHTQGIFPFAFRCTLDGTTTNSFAFRVIGNVMVNDGVSFTPILYFTRWGWVGNDKNASTSQMNELLEQNQQQIQQQEEQIQQQEETNKQLGDLNSNLTDSSSDDPSPSFDSFNSKVAENGVITQLITMPVTLYRSILNSLNNSCRSYSLGNLFGTDITLPCISLSNILGSSLLNVIDVLFSGLFIFSIGKKFIKVFNKFSSMEEGDVLDD